MTSSGKHRKHLLTCMPLSKEELTRHIGNRIREYRNDRKLTIEGLAVAAEMEYTQLSRIERGKINTGIFHIYKIAGSLGVSMNELLTGLPASKHGMLDGKPVSQKQMSTKKARVRKNGRDAKSS
jgi:transcriptional regulator with XRE-family HTH domain